MKILIADSLGEAMTKKLEDMGYNIVYDPTLEGKSLIKIIKKENPEILVVRSTKVPSEALEVKSLTLIIRAGAGVNNIDVPTASKLGIYVANCPSKNSIAVAELAIGHMLSLDRHLVDCTTELKQGKWNKKTYSQARGLYGRTLGIIGVGNISKEIIIRAKSFGLHIVAWSRSLSKDNADSLGIQFAETVVQVASQSDIVSIHLALTPETNQFINKEFFDALPEKAYIINTARGDVIDEIALLDAINKKGIKYASDVWTNQPSQSQGDFSSSLIHSSNVYGSHHIGASTEQAQSAITDETVRILHHFKKTGEVLNCVNLIHAKSSHFLIIKHENKVGVLSKIFMFIREGQINILEMQNVLFATEAAACATIQIDKNATPALLKMLEQIPEIISLQEF